MQERIARVFQKLDSRSAELSIQETECNVRGKKPKRKRKQLKVKVLVLYMCSCMHESGHSVFPTCNSCQIKSWDCPTT